MRVILKAKLDEGWMEWCPGENKGEMTEERERYGQREWKTDKAVFS